MLDLHYVRAQIRQDLTAKRPGQVLREVEDPDVPERVLPGPLDQGSPGSDTPKRSSTGSFLSKS